MVFVLSYLALLFGNFGSPCRDYREVKDFLKSIGMEDLYEKCVEEELTMDLIQILSDDNLKCIGVKTLGARMRFIRAASEWEWIEQVTNDQSAAMWPFMNQCKARQCIVTPKYFKPRQGKVM